MHLTVDGRCIQAASPLGNYKTELYDPAMEKYQPSPQWINLFVFVKDPENKVRQALTPCSPAPFTGPLPSTPALRDFRTWTDAFSLTSSFLVWPVRVRTWDTPGPRGSFTFTSQAPGEHEVCLHLKSTRFALFYDGKLAIHLDMQLSEHTNDYAELAANDKLTLLHLRIQQLVEQVEKIQKEQEYQRARLGPVGTADV
ncbi:transmembrane emp24 domain-containing protein 9-like [Ovis aries]|uniref:transmembrane emp24 domain-containing protein 9-like n=1 Tax=Ovis aries TaxID=9940 RepID=UPI001C2E8238|nr:transmembrane emp24 domain-containing protein 9-like [Ovis aries]